MSKFKQSISVAVGTLLVAMMVLATSAEVASAKTRNNQFAASTVRSRIATSGYGRNICASPAGGNYSFGVRANGGARQTQSRANHGRAGAGDFNGGHNITTRRASLFPYLEQGNIYRLRRP